MTEPDAQDPLRLADEVAAATGPDRELDRQIHEQVRGKQYRWAEFGGVPAFADQKRIAVEVEPSWLTDEMYQWWLDRSDVGVLPAYTASLDAAMALVPKGWRIWTADFSIERRFVWMLCGPKLTWITHEDGSQEGGDDWYQSGVAATPALALCAAALRARSVGAK